LNRHLISWIRTEPAVSTSAKASSSAAATVPASVPVASKPAPVVVSKAEASTDIAAAAVVAPAVVAVAGEHGHVKFGQSDDAVSDVTAPATKPAKKSALKASVSISTSEAAAEPAAVVATAPVEALDNDDGGLHVWHSDLGQHSLFSNLGVKLLELWTSLLESGKVNKHCFLCRFHDFFQFSFVLSPIRTLRSFECTRATMVRRGCFVVCCLTLHAITPSLTTCLPPTRNRT
jgi:hypothetical protein